MPKDYFDNLNKKQREALEASAEKWLSKKHAFLDLFGRKTPNLRNPRVNLRNRIFMIVILLVVSVIGLLILLSPPHYSEKEIAINEQNFIEQIKNMHPYEQQFYDVLTMLKTVDMNLYARLVTVPTINIAASDSDIPAALVMKTYYKEDKIVGSTLWIRESWLAEKKKTYTLAYELLHETSHYEQKKSNKIKFMLNKIICHPWFNSDIVKRVHGNFKGKPLSYTTVEICAVKLSQELYDVYNTLEEVDKEKYSNYVYGDL